MWQQDWSLQWNVIQRWHDRPKDNNEWFRILVIFYDGEAYIAEYKIVAILYLEIVFKIVQVVGLNLTIIKCQEAVQS